MVLGIQKEGNEYLSAYVVKEKQSPNIPLVGNQINNF